MTPMVTDTGSPPIPIEGTEPGVVLPTLTPGATPTPDAARIVTRLYKETADIWDFAPISSDGHYSVFYANPEMLGETPPAGYSHHAYLYDHMTGAMRIISANEEGEPGDFWSYPVTMSTDGSTAAFWSYSTNLVDLETDCIYPDPEGEGCGLGHVYVFNVFSGGLQHIEVGGGWGLGVINDIDLSGDGRWLAFVSNAAMTRMGTWVLDRVTGQFTQISAEGLGVALFDDGRYVAYIAREESYFPEDHNNTEDLFLYDLQTGERIWVSRPHAGIAPNNHASGFVYHNEGGGRAFSISADGRYITFDSGQFGLAHIPVTTGCVTIGGPLFEGCTHVYLYDVPTGQVEIVDLTPNSAPSDHGAWGGVVSPDGRFVAFGSNSCNLIASPPPPSDLYFGCPPSVYLRDRQTHQTHLVSQTYYGTIPQKGASFVRFTSDAQSIIFYSESPDILPDLPPLEFRSPYDRARLFIVDIADLIRE